MFGGFLGSHQNILYHLPNDQPWIRNANKRFHDISNKNEYLWNCISMENAETKIKCQKQQFLSNVVLGLMTFFNVKILSKAISLTNYLTEIHLEWRWTNQSVWVHRKMTCYMILTQMTSLHEQSNSMCLIQQMRMGDWLLFSLANIQTRTIFLWHLLKSHC